MTINKKGGNKGKKMARKNVAPSFTRALVVKTSDLEHYGCVTDIYGGRICGVTDTEGHAFRLHIRGKFKPNAVSRGSIVLFGEREFSSSKNDCDLLYVYDDRDFGNLTGIDSLLDMRAQGSNKPDNRVNNDLVAFSMDATMVESGVKPQRAMPMATVDEQQDADLEEIWDTI